MKKILFPTDFSPAAANAFRFAAEVALASGASIDLLHTYRVPIDYHIPASLIASIDAEEHEVVDILLQQTIRQYFDAHPGHEGRLQVNPKAVQGFTTDVILNFARTEGHDLIVMGTKGATGLAEVLLGSMTAGIIEDATCPVLAIPEQARFEGVGNVLYASDFLPKDYQSLHQLVAFAQLFGAHTHCVHISDDENYFIDDVSFDLMRDQYEEHFPKDTVSFKVLLGKGLEDGLMEAVGAHKADVIALTTRKRSFLDRLFSPSRTKRMAYHSKVPLLVFHE
jgi:nucleotide-binding universal stress UspA family protein